MIVKDTEFLVISLQDSARRRTFSGPPEGSSIKWTFFDASTKADCGIRYDDDRARLLYGKGLSTSAQGCFSSHYRCWLYCLEHDLDHVVVLEDDVVVDWKAAESIAKISWTDHGVDYLRLYCREPTPLKVVSGSFLHSKRRLVELIGNPLGTQGYLVTRKGARILTQKIREISRPVDVELDRAWHYGLRNLAVFPSPMFELDGPSAIAQLPDKKFLPNRTRSAARFLIRAREKGRRLLYHSRPRRWIEVSE